DGAAASYLAAGSRSLTCIDTIAPMIDAAKKRLGEHAHVRTLVADVHDLPFSEESFDSVLLFHTLTYVERPKRAVAECARVLRPGGRLVVLSLDEHDQSKITSAFGERHPGFAPRALKALLSKAALDPISCQIACRETKKPHFVVLSAVARKPEVSPRKKSPSRS
ncbi:MAG: class I SAM-dependent methyltransferase, partial [Polyangiaceae bacterium]|nr:class I SAM-dependent methyltransferase [Polyangiaceae bacterium]